MAEGGSPECETQKQQITNLLKTQLKKGDTWYLIDTRWFKQWKKFVGFDNWDSYNVGEESANPGPIDNGQLFSEENADQLKEHLIDELDYILLPAEGWNKLVGWYGIVEGQVPISRRVIEQGMFVKHCKVEVYLMDLKLCENSNLSNTVSKLFSRADTIEDLEKDMRTLFTIAEDKEVRLWNRYMSNTYEHLSKPENTLQDAGLFQGQVIVIEQKNDDGTWPRHAKRSGGYNSSYESNSSYSPSYSGYNYYDSAGRGTAAPGLCGLSNLGNTCFMNSALQCISNVPPLTQYFLDDRWVKEVNEENPLGMRGEIARNFAELIKIMWSGKYSFTVPRNFKVSVGRLAPQFSGYQQHDSQELLAFLLDGLHEDLNRIHSKPYIEQKDADGRTDEDVSREAWNNYRKRNDSVIVDTCHGLLKSTVHCPKCAKISVTFDPFCYLSLPLPVKKERQIEVFWVPLNPEKKMCQYKLTVPKMGTVLELCRALSSYPLAEPQQKANAFAEHFHGVSSDANYSADFLKHKADFESAHSDIFSSSSDSPEVYNEPFTFAELKTAINSSSESSPGADRVHYTLLKHLPDSSLLVLLELYNTVRYLNVEESTGKWWITADENITDTANDYDGDTEPSLLDHSESNGMEVSSDDCEPTPSSEDASDEFEDNDQDEETNSVCPRLFKLTLVNSYGTAELDTKLKDDDTSLKLNSRSYIAIDWHPLAKEKFLDEGSAEELDQHESVQQRSKPRQVIQLNDCLELFTTTEKLGENDPWYCPKCKEHQQATKKFDLWSLPNVLIIHLKRFSYNRYWRDKIDALVEFPTSGLSLKKYIIGGCESPASYDLIAVSNHYGGLGGGHYTAFAKNKNDGEWYYYDDSSCTHSSEDAVVTKAAYVLVYMKQGIFPRPQAKSLEREVAATASNEKSATNGFGSDEDMQMN
ncbi:hypothetical protein ScPMuIL_007656 [Solemya velum]